MLLKKNNKIRQFVIRLRPRGKKYYQIFDIIVTYKDVRNKGIIIEKLGFINPQFTNERIVFVNLQRFSYWLSKGIFVNSNVKKYLVKMWLLFVKKI